MRAFFVAVLLVALAGVAIAQPRSAPMKPDARFHFDRGLRLYEHHQYEDAIAELRAALSIDPQPDILYALGQAERRRGNCERAIEYYSSCLALVKDPAAAAAVKVQIERCQVATGEPKPPAPPPAPVEEPTTPAKEERADLPTATATTAPPPAPLPPPPVPLVQPAPPHRGPWIADPLGVTLSVAGLAGVAAGGALLGIAELRLDDAANSYQQYADARSAPTLWIGGVVALAAGGALILGGIVRYAVVAKHRRAPVGVAGAL
jgi:tetratricopeptide (TPR) repeat protein